MFDAGGGCVLALQLEDVFSARAKESKIEKVSHYRQTGEVVQISEQPAMERKSITQVAKVANVSHDTIAK
jgi:hypothetical protein